MAAARGRGGGGRSPPAVGAHPGPAQRQHAPRRARTPRAYRPLRRGRLEPPLVRLPELLLLPRLGVGTGPPRRPPPVAADARVAGDADPGDADRHPLRPAALRPRRHGGRALGLLAALLLAANFLHVRDSHVLKDEILLPVGVLASLWTLASWV